MIPNRLEVVSRKTSNKRKRGMSWRGGVLRPIEEKEGKKKKRRRRRRKMMIDIYQGGKQQGEIYSDRHLVASFAQTKPAWSVKPAPA